MAQASNPAPERQRQRLSGRRTSAWSTQQAPGQLRLCNKTVSIKKKALRQINCRSCMPFLLPEWPLESFTSKRIKAFAAGHGWPVDLREEALRSPRRFPHTCDAHMYRGFHFILLPVALLILLQLLVPPSLRHPLPAMGAALRRGQESKVSLMVTFFKKNSMFCFWREGLTV